jgi:IS30 family transposase
VGAASWEPATTSVGRGERRIFFIHLPQQCTIRIYTISGRLVQTMMHSSTLDNGQESWNLVTRDGLDLAYGVYVFHVDAGPLGSRIDRFAILK